MSRIEVANESVSFPGEDGNSRILISLPILATQIVFEGTVSTTQQPQSIPSASARVRPQRRWICGGRDGEVQIGRQVMRNTVVAVDPGCAHGTRLGLALSVHEVVDHKG